MKRKAILLANIDLRDKVFGGGRLQKFAEMVDLTDGSHLMGDLTAVKEAMSDKEIVISTWGMPRLDHSFLQAAPNLKVVFYSAGSIKPFATDESYDRNIIIQSSWAANAIPVAEFTVAQIVLGLKNYFTQVRESKNALNFIKSPVHGCYDKKVGLIGMGMIGREIAQRLKAYRLEVLAYDPYLTESEANALGVKLASLDEMFATCHLVSLHAPNIPETKGMIQGWHIASMLPNSCFINTSRGALVDEPGLVDALRKRPDLTALLDVTDPEPPPADSPMWTLPNLIMSPHIAGAMDDECWRMADCSIDELSRYLAGEKLKYEVTREMLPRMA